MQAQDYAGAKWALAIRTRGATDAEVERELSVGDILRTHVLRPTWHFVRPEDIRWMLTLTAPRVNAAMAYHDRYFELSSTMYRRSHDAITKALRDGQHLTRAELRTALERAGLKGVSGQRLGRLMMRAELDALICSGARRGKEATYALLDARVPSAAPVERDAALRELAERYFSTRGPATVRDFAWWSGLTVADAKRSVQIARSSLRVDTIEGQEYWSSEGAVPRARPSVHLLPNYDEYFVGYKDRGAITRRLAGNRSAAAFNALMGHVVIVDGQLVGNWRRSSATKATVELALRAKLTGNERARVVTAAARFSAFLGSPGEAPPGSRVRRGLSQ